MMVYNFYEKYRADITEEEQKLVDAAKEDYERMCAEAEKAGGAYTAYQDGEKDREGRYIGFEDQNGKFIQNPIVYAHMKIARDRAVEQLKKWPRLPEDGSTFMRYPAVDPLGHSGSIDMAFEQRLAAIRVRMKNCSPAARQWSDIMLRMLDNPGNIGLMQEMKDGVKLYAENQRIYSRASKLCLDEVASQKLHEMSRSMEVAEPVKNFNVYLQGIEYILGIRPGPVTDEVRDLYDRKLRFGPDWSVVEWADRRLDRDMVEIDFKNLDNRMLQYQFIDPSNWNKTPEQVAAEYEKNGLAWEDGTKIITPYARATVGLELDEIYNPIDARNPYTGFDRGDMIIIDGKSVRERMHEDYIQNLKRPEADFERYYQANIKQAANELVAGALMAGKRVDAYVLDEKGRIRFAADRHGNIKDRPVSLRKKGYEPSPLNKVTLSTWERFAAKFGFYKEKVAKAAEYERAVEEQKKAREKEEERMLDAKVRMKGRWHAALGKNLDACSIMGEDMRAQFFANWMRDHEGLDNYGLHSPYSVSRGALTSFALCRMMELGYSPEDIYDLDALVDEKLAVGDEIIQHIQDNDHEWIAETIFHGNEKIADYIDVKCAEFPALQDSYIFSNDNRILFSLAHAAFDAGQEKNRVCKDLFVQAAQEEYGQQLGIEKADEIEKRVLSADDFFKRAKLYESNIVELLESGDPLQFFTIVNFEAARRVYKDVKETDPNRPFTKYTNEDSTEMANAGYFTTMVTAGGDKNDMSVLSNLVDKYAPDQEAAQDIMRHMVKHFVENDVDTQMEIKVGKNFGECYFRALPPLREKVIEAAHVSESVFVSDAEFEAVLAATRAAAAEADASSAARDVIHGRVKPVAEPPEPNYPAPEPPVAEPPEPDYLAPEPPGAEPIVPPAYDAPKPPVHDAPEPPVYDAPEPPAYDAPKPPKAAPARPAPKAPEAAPVPPEYDAPVTTKTVAPPLQPKRPAPSIRPNGPAPKTPKAAPVPAEYDAPVTTKTVAPPPQPKRPAPKVPQAGGGGGRTR